mgnify:CR=1 FL=1
MRSSLVTPHRALFTGVWIAVSFIASVAVSGGIAYALGMVRPFVYYGNPLTTLILFFAVPVMVYLYVLCR